MSAVRNVLILGGVAVGGFLAYRYFRNRFSAPVEQDYAAPTPAPYKPGSVRADQLTTVRTGNPITKKEKGMQYYPILSSKKVGIATERTFRPQIDGYFTGRILTQAKKEYAEVQPASSSLSGLGEMSGAYDDLKRSFLSIADQIDTLAGKRKLKERRQLIKQRNLTFSQIQKTPEFAVEKSKCESVAQSMARRFRCGQFGCKPKVVMRNGELRCMIEVEPGDARSEG